MVEVATVVGCGGGSNSGGGSGGVWWGVVEAAAVVISMAEAAVGVGATIEVEAAAHVVD